MNEKSYIENKDVTINHDNEWELPDDPVQAFSKWYRAATENDEILPNGMTLSTVDNNHFPDSRIVLMKSFSAEGINFFTNFESDKGRQLANNPNVSLVFWWKSIMRQVRIRGQVNKMTREESEHYFATRPRHSQVGAILSPQSREIASRDELANTVAAYEQAHAGEDLVCPEYWGGYTVKYDSFEFWQSRDHRLHDRVLYYLQNGQWHQKYLAP